MSKGSNIMPLSPGSDHLESLTFPADEVIYRLFKKIVSFQ
jgi:hypothetical protein